MRWFFALSFVVIVTTQAQTLTVFAASSLTEAFTEVAAAFETSNPSADIVLNFAGSSTLATQIEQGAPADLLASADWPNLLRVASVEDATVFATNALVVVTPPESPVTSLESLATASYLLILAGETVPAGRYALEVLEKLEALYGSTYREEVVSHLVSQETNVRQVAAKIALGEADAALVYTTDAKTLQSVQTIDIPAVYNVRAEYPIVLLANGDTAALAEQFLEFLFSFRGQAILARHGFNPP